jgi:hypothetical protein
MNPPFLSPAGESDSGGGVGYANFRYAESLATQGQPVRLSGSGTWMLKRAIPGTDHYDATGCYPLLVCERWPGLAGDLDSVDEGLVSMVAVIDPLGQHDEAYLRRCFPDLVLPYKEHFVADLRKPRENAISSHHQRCLRKALRQVVVEHCPDPLMFAAEWVALYEAFIDRHQMTGSAAFSKQALICQLGVPGLVMFRAKQASVVGFHLWYVHGDVAYAHLAAYTDLGYRLGASYALFGTAFDYFAAMGLRWVLLGATPDVVNPKSPASAAGSRTGLADFKRGWATSTRPAYLCGRIFARDLYQEISRAKGATDAPYFPAYRHMKQSSQHADLHLPV